MIFVILGTQKFQFNRLLHEVDRLIEEGIIKEEVFAQTGYSDYCPRNYKYESFMDRDVFRQYTNNSRIVITHGGTGAIITALKQGKKVIGVPRLKKFGEHVDDHQMDIVGAFNESKLIMGITDISELKGSLETIDSENFEVYKSNTENFMDIIDGFLLTI